MHKDAKKQMIEYIKDFEVLREIIPSSPIYLTEKKDKLYALHECILATQPNLDSTFTKEELKYFISENIGHELQEKYKHLAKNKKYEKLTSLLSKDELNQVVNSIENEISNLPYKYKIYFDFEITNKAFDSIKIPIDTDMNIRGIDRTTIPPSSKSDLHHYLIQSYGTQYDIKPGNDLVLEISLNGFIDDIGMTPKLEIIINKFKTLIALGIIFNIFSPNYAKYISNFSSKSLLVLNKNSKFLRGIEMEYDLSDLLHKVELHESTLRTSRLEEIIYGVGPIDESTLFTNRFKEIQKYFAFQNKSDKTKQEQRYSKRLSNILTWYLMGASSINKSIGFISLIFAFESLFMMVPTETGELLSTGLAGRCAYFISDQFKEREEIIDHIGKIYKLRNMIVHEGGQISFSDSWLFTRLFSLLQFSLNKEIRNIT